MTSKVSRLNICRSVFEKINHTILAPLMTAGLFLHRTVSFLTPDQTPAMDTAQG